MFVKNEWVNERRNEQTAEQKKCIMQIIGHKSCSSLGLGDEERHKQHHWSSPETPHTRYYFSQYGSLKYFLGKLKKIMLLL